jgi:hypothetical protein
MNFRGVNVMRKATFTITSPHLFSPMSAFFRDRRSHFITLRFKVDETLQINTSSFLVLNKIVLIKVVKDRNILVLLYPLNTQTLLNQGTKVNGLLQ